MKSSSLVYLIGALLTLAAAAPAQSAVLNVAPGESIQAALDLAQPGDTVRVQGAPGIQYNERPVFPAFGENELLTLEGVANPVINTNVPGDEDILVLRSGVTLRGLTVFHLTRDARTLVEIPYNVQHATIDGCTLLGQVQLNGSGNRIENSSVRGLGPVLNILGGNNVISKNLIWSVRPVMSSDFDVFQPVVFVSATPLQSQAVGGNLFSGDTIVGWRSLRPKPRSAPFDAVGLFVHSLGGPGNRVVDSIIVRSARRRGDILSGLHPVDVAHSFLKAGTRIAAVQLGTGVLVGVGVPIRFVASRAGDFRLQSRSPAIDKGDPDSPLDPDGTRRDLGAFYFDTRLSRLPVAPADPDSDDEMA